MGTEVLPPQNLLAVHAPPASFHRRKNFLSNRNLTHLIVNRRPHYSMAQKKNSPRPDRKRSTAAAENGDGVKKVNQGGAPEARRKGGLVMGQVTLLRRGEALDALASKIKGGKSNPRSPIQKSDGDMTVLGTDRIGPESPDMLPKQIHLSPPSFRDVYAGSAFTLSPSPRALPLPSFFNKKLQTNGVKVGLLDDLATRQLRRLLRLD